MKIHLVKYKISFGFIMIMFIGCNNDNDCIAQSANFTQVQNCNTINSITTLSNLQYEIIRTQNDFNNQITTSCNVNIDFSQYSLIMGEVFSDKIITGFNYKYLKLCEPNSYDL